MINWLFYSLSCPAFRCDYWHLIVFLLYLIKLTDAVNILDFESFCICKEIFVFFQNFKG